MRAFVALIALAGVLAVAPSEANPGHHTRQSRGQNATSLTAAQLTGTYKRGNWGELDVQALPGGKVRFHFDGLADLHAPGGPNIGDANGTLPLHKNVAVYTSPEGGGRLILRFFPRRVFITQAGGSAALGFGMGVEAGGVYRKTSSRTPKFDPEDH